jgi:hypothetical protein
MLLLIKQMVSVQKIHVFLQLNRIGLFGTKRAYVYLEKQTLPEVFLPKAYSIHPGKECARCSCF